MSDRQIAADFAVSQYAIIAAIEQRAAAIPPCKLEVRHADLHICEIVFVGGQERGTEHGISIL